MHDDEQRKKLLNQLVSRPETLSSMDVAPEVDDSADMSIQEPEDQEYEAPEDMTEGVEQAGAASDEMIAQSPRNQYKPAPEINEELMKLLGRQPTTDDIEVEPETIEDPSASPDMRKAALEKVKQKYLGR